MLDKTRFIGFVGCVLLLAGCGGEPVTPPSPAENAAASFAAALSAGDADQLIPLVAKLAKTPLSERERNGMRRLLELAKGVQVEFGAAHPATTEGHIRVPLTIVGKGEQARSAEVVCLSDGDTIQITEQSMIAVIRAAVEANRVEDKADTVRALIWPADDK